MSEAAIVTKTDLKAEQAPKPVHELLAEKGETDFVLALSQTCRCGERLAYKKKTKLWKCVRFFMGTAEKTCQAYTEKMFPKIRDQYNPRPVKVVDDVEDVEIRA